MSKELVSVVVPTYNRAYCVARALDSALGQTHRNVEVILVDDGSTDNTTDLIRERYRNEPRLRYLTQRNQGVSTARNTGILAARGDYVGLLDSDDYWHPWKLEAQLAAFRRFPQAGMVWTDMEAIHPDGQIFDPKYLRTMYDAYRIFGDDDLFSGQAPLRELAPGLGSLAENASVFVGDIFSPMIMGSLVHTSTVLLRRERIDQVGLFNPELKCAGEDYDFHLRTCRLGEVAFINLSSIQYQRGLTDHLLRDEHRLALAQNFLKAVTPFLERDRDRIHLPDAMIRRMLAKAHSWAGEMALDTGDMPLAREHLRQSLSYKWFQPRFAGMWLLTMFPFSIENRMRTLYRSMKTLLRSEASVLEKVLAAKSGT
jgi:glycosyltransferase involved in cell wall biosynthesis